MKCVSFSLFSRLLQLHNGPIGQHFCVGAATPCWSWEVTSGALRSSNSSLCYRYRCRCRHPLPVGSNCVLEQSAAAVAEPRQFLLNDPSGGVTIFNSPFPLLNPFVFIRLLIDRFKIRIDSIRITVPVCTRC